MHHRASVILSFLFVIAYTTAVFAQNQESLVIGDGAKDCSAAKVALYEGPHPLAFSAASANIDITYYHLDLTLPMVTPTLSGTVRIEGTVVGTSLSTLVLDLQNTMNVTAVALANGTPLAFAHPGAVLNITMPAPVAPGGSIAVDVTYNGAPNSGGFGYFVFGTRAGDLFAWSLSEPYGAREWWPCKDHPSDKADSVRVTVTVPSIYRVGSQGLLTESANGGNKTYDWVSRYPISNYLVSLAAGDYRRHEGTYTRPAPLAALYGPLTMKLDHLVYADGTDALPAGWAAVSDMISVFEEWYGPYPFWAEKYGHSECTFSGGMEHQTMTSLSGSSISLVSHELGHQWYGDNVTTKYWPHLWLNEGFATYSALLYFQQRPAAVPPGTYETQLASTMTSAQGASGTLVLQDTTSVSNMFAQSRVYSKGAMVLYMLRWIVGDNVFKNIMQAYTSDPQTQYGVATTSDFKRVCEDVSGLELDTFFSQWVTTGTGYPIYAVCSSWSQVLGGWHVVVSLQQQQGSGLSNVNAFVMPVECLVHTVSGDVSVILQNTQRTQNFSFLVPNQPTSVVIDPGKRILRGDTINLGTCSVTAAGPPAIRTDIVGLYPNPASGRFAVDYTSGEEGQFELGVYDVAGRRVLTKAMTRTFVGAGSEDFDTSQLAAGVYFVRLRPPHGDAITRKLVIVR